jgi:hypothetical protein
MVKNRNKALMFKSGHKNYFGNFLLINLASKNNGLGKAGESGPWHCLGEDGQVVR